jgi:hypothetical protein
MKILHKITNRKANWIGHILRRNCLVKHVIEVKVEGRIEVTRRRGKIYKQLLDDLKEKSGYWKLKEETLDHTLWKTLFERGYGPVVRLPNELMILGRYDHKIGIVMYV